MSAVIAVAYPRTEGVTFDMDYYLNTHMKLVEKHWGPHGLKSWHVVQFDENDPSGLHCQGVLFWSSMEEYEKCFALGIKEVHEDLPNYTNGMPQLFKGALMRDSAGNGTK